MTSLTAYALEQYILVKGSRNVLFDYCRTISPENFIRPHPSFGKGGNLIHVANTYEAWVAQRALGRNPHFLEYDAIDNIEEIVQLYENKDLYVQEFIAGMDTYSGPISYEKDGINNSISTLQLFSHVITHEFHHKGQILSLSRHLGYVPVDTDIMR